MTPAVVGVALLAGACGTFDDAIPSVPLPAPTGATGSPLPGTTGATGAVGSVTPTGSPGVLGPVTQGTASLRLSGGVNTTVTFNRLTAGSWAPPPGTIALSWGAAGDQVLSLAGPSFTSQIATDPSHTLTFTVNVDGAQATYVSAAGECTVTVSPALPTQMGGTFFCTNLPGTGGEPAVNAQGSFSATG